MIDQSHLENEAPADASGSVPIVASRGKAAADSVPRTCPQNLKLERRAGQTAW
jgi:hypothetical protein